VSGDRRAGRRREAASTSWDRVATWYDGWVGERGSHYHQRLAVPAALRLLDPRAGDRVLDIGCGQGVLAPYVTRASAQYTGVDASPRLTEFARRRHGTGARFVVADARKLASSGEVERAAFDAAVFMLSLQDMDPIEPVFQSTAWALKDDGRIVILLTHPAFRVPRQSGWGWDEGRKLVYRRVDRYLTPLPVPMKPYPGGEGGVTRSFHRPISYYVNRLADVGFCVDRMEEVPGHRISTGSSSARADRLAREEIPLFLGLRAWQRET
jgi:ubiquinone/menaquinone biosynthesis C-methylase UbiE